MRLFYSTIIYFALFSIILLFLNCYDVKGDYVAGVVTATVGYFAYFVYEKGKSNQLEDAARIIILDIRNAEDAVNGVRLHSSRQSWLKVVWQENSWLKYKHLLVGELNSDEFKLLDQFFHNWHGLTKAQIDAGHYQSNAMIGKSNATASKLIELVRTDADFAQKHKEIVDRANLDNWLFQPNELTDRANLFLQEFQFISGTTGFAKLRKLAGLKN